MNIEITDSTEHHDESQFPPVGQGWLNPLSAGSLQDGASGGIRSMKVLIVAKTRHGSGACIGGITLDEGRSVRLIAADAAFNEHVGLEYTCRRSLGSGCDARRARDPAPRREHHRPVEVPAGGHERLPERFIETHMPPVTGGANLLYAGLTQAARTGALYIAERTGIPPFSTTFWRPDQPLQMTDDSKRIRYRYPTPDGGRTLTFVGFQEPIATIPAGALVRVSLAHWWRPEDDHTGELRCVRPAFGLVLAENRPAGPACELHAKTHDRTSLRGPQPKATLAPHASAGVPHPRKTDCFGQDRGPSQ